jgi:hypothetical protein
MQNKCEISQTAIYHWLNKENFIEQINRLFYSLTRKSGVLFLANLPLNAPNL